MNKVFQAVHRIIGDGDIPAFRKNELLMLEYCLLEWEKNEDQEPE